MPGRQGSSAPTVAITLLGVYVVFGSSFTAVKIALATTSARPEMTGGTSWFLPRLKEV